MGKRVPALEGVAVKFTQTPLSGAYLVDLEPIEDERGFFARAFCRETFAQHGLNPEVSQCNLAYTKFAGVLRGLHLQLPPAGEAKLVRCLQGEIYDVIVDCRAGSQTFLQHFAVTLRAGDRQALYIPESFAHGYQALTDGAEIMYQVTANYSPDHERGLRFDDTALKIDWPLAPRSMTQKDRDWPLIADGAMETWF